MTNVSYRETASKILNEYLAKVGGKEAILAAWEEKKEAAKKGKKRSRASTGADATNGTKRGRKNGHPKDESPPLSATKEWKPPTGSWEELVTGIDACEGNEGAVVVYLTWKGGHKTQHPLAQVYKRCPQRMLKFYESHLFVLLPLRLQTSLTAIRVFKKNEDIGDAD
jgi:chromobox protein 1